MVPKTTNGRFWLLIALAVGTGLALLPFHPGLALLLALAFLAAASVLSKAPANARAFFQHWLSHFTVLLLSCTLLEGLFRLSEGRPSALYLAGPLVFWALFALSDRFQALRQAYREDSR